MNESLAAGGDAAPGGAASAGALLRAARERQGLHIAALAAAIKVSPQRLEALEADRLDELPDVAFARALAQAMCRALKTDAQPVLALLPAAADPHRLERIGSGLNTPFIGRPGRDDPVAAAWWARPAVWAPALVLLVAALVYLVPEGLPPTADGGPAPEVSGAAGGPALAAGAGQAPAPAAQTPATPGAAAPAAAPGGATSAAVETVHLAPAADAEPAPAALLWLRASEPSWVEIRDGAGRVLLARTLQAGESLSLDGGLPLRLTVGNAAATTVSLRGRAVDLAAAARDNVARLTLE
jgi:cytoskeleton protein RodZ